MGKPDSLLDTRHFDDLGLAEVRNQLDLHTQARALL